MTYMPDAPCSPACPFAACDDCPHQGDRTQLDRQTTIYDHMEDQCSR